MMKVWLICAAAGMSFTAPAPAQADATLAVPPGTEVELMVLAEVNTRVSEPGSIVRLRLNKAVTVDGRILLPIGTPAFGKVDSMTKSGIAMSRGEIAIRLTHIDAGGQRIKLEDEMLVYQARGGKNDDAVKILFAPFYAPFAPANSAKLKAGDLIRAKVAKPPGESIATPAGSQQ